MSSTGRGSSLARVVSRYRQGSRPDALADIINANVPDQHRGLWLGIGIGSAATGVTALIAATAMNGPVNNVLEQAVQHVVGPTYYNVAGDMLAWLVGVWGLLLVIYIVYAWRRSVRGRE
jgi:hypothetical protein